jgi:60 kDa SS-A/Ro ribonucleoprotein
VASINAAVKSAVGAPPRNHEGVVTPRITPELELRRAVLSCFLWENEFYESGVSIHDRIVGLTKSVPADVVAELAVEARIKGNLRHVPLLLVRELAHNLSMGQTIRPYLSQNPSLVSETLYRVINRVDEMAEFLALYWEGGDRRKNPGKALPKQVQKGLAKAFTKFSPYQLAKYNRDGAVKLKDVLFLAHPKPKDDKQATAFQKLADGTLESPDTWEVALSGGADKKETWERLIREKKLGALATLRNLRNMIGAGVESTLIRQQLADMDTDRVLPFRFIIAARYAPAYEDSLEQAMFKNLADAKKLPGKTVLLLDVSPSMAAQLSGKSELSRRDAGAALAMLLREICEVGNLFAFSSEVYAIPPRRGFALRDAFAACPSNGTLLGKAIQVVDKQVPDYDRLIVLSDEESQDTVGQPRGKAYMVNVASTKNGVGYQGNWTHIDGFSESIVDYIREVEEFESQEKPGFSEEVAG